MKAHSPQDEIYGPLSIPDYCWPIIDTFEFQRLRYIPQLGSSSFVYPGATHTRFEHCLGVCHLAFTVMEHLKLVQPELNVQPKHVQSVVLAGLCHDFGHGPWSHVFEYIAHQTNPDWDHEEFSGTLIHHVNKKYKIGLSEEIIDAAASFISGKPYKDYPKWLASIVANHDCDIDIDKFDYLSRDMNRCLNTCRFEFGRLISQCRVVDGTLAWKISEQPTIDRLFYTRNNMHERVYQHRVTTGINLMIDDMMLAANQILNLGEKLDNPDEFCKLDCRLLRFIEDGAYGEEAQNIAHRIKQRQLYKYVNEFRANPENEKVAQPLTNKKNEELIQDVASYGPIPAEKWRIGRISFRFGLTKYSNPLLHVPFWQEGVDKVVYLQEEDITCMIPIQYAEKGVRFYVTDSSLIGQAKEQVAKWMNAVGL